MSCKSPLTKISTRAPYCQTFRYDDSSDSPTDLIIADPALFQKIEEVARVVSSMDLGKPMAVLTAKMMIARVLGALAERSGGAATQLNPGMPHFQQPLPSPLDLGETADAAVGLCPTTPVQANDSVRLPADPLHLQYVGTANSFCSSVGGHSQKDPTEHYQHHRLPPSPTGSDSGSLASIPASTVSKVSRNNFRGGNPKRVVPVYSGNQSHPPALIKTVFEVIRYFDEKFKANDVNTISQFPHLGWAVIKTVWDVTPADFDRNIMEILLVEKPTQVSEEILLALSAVDLRNVRSLSAFAASIIKEYNALSHVCMRFLAGVCPLDHTQCPFVHPEHTPGWDALWQRWQITFRCFDYGVINFLCKQKVEQREAILLAFSEMNLGKVKNLSAYLSCFIHTHQNIRTRF